MTRRTRKTGATMLEMLAWMGILCVFLSVVSAAYVSMLRCVKKQNRQLDLLADAQTAQRFIVQDVRCAAALPEHYAAYKADASTLICRLSPLSADTESASTVVVVYTLGGSNKRSLIRYVFPPGDGTKPCSQRVLIDTLESVTFDRVSDSQANLVRVTLTAPPGLLHTSQPTVFTFLVGETHD